MHAWVIVELWLHTEILTVYMKIVLMVVLCVTRSSVNDNRT